MPELALAWYAVFLLLAFGWRTWLQVRLRGRVAMLAIADVVEPIGALDRGAVHAIGIALAVLGMAGGYGSYARRVERFVPGVGRLHR